MVLAKAVNLIIILFKVIYPKYLGRVNQGKIETDLGKHESRVRYSVSLGHIYAFGKCTDC